MNIDLFLSPHGESGLLCDGPLPARPAGVIFDAQTQELTVELGDAADPLHMNIPVEDAHRELLLFTPKIHIGVLEGGLIAESVQLPLLYLNDPYGSGFGDNEALARSRRSLIGFEQFMKRCTTAQPIHREDLGDENSAGCVLRGMDPRALQYVPQLVRQRMMEASPNLAAEPRAPGLGLGGGSVRRPVPRKRNEDERE